MKKIVFQANHLSLRGTEIAIFDYAFHNQKFLGNESVVLYDVNSIENSPLVLRKFQKMCRVIPYISQSDLICKIDKLKPDFVYTLKSGSKNGLVSCGAPLIVHAVFPTSLSEIHGASYAFVSEWLSDVCSNNLVPFVPHMVDMPNLMDDLRGYLNIPKNDLVLGNYGGSNSFNVPSALSSVRKLLTLRSDIWFIFMNIPIFINHPRAIFLPGTASIQDKVKFINTSDAMLHARKLGESFGLACAEFSSRNKPILTYSKSPQRNHLKVLGDKALKYSNEKELCEILLSINRGEIRNQVWDCYTTLFSPEAVMRKFNHHLIIEAIKSDGTSKIQYLPKFKDKFHIYKSFLKQKYYSAIQNVENY
jgi:hypothetical protein